MSDKEILEKAIQKAIDGGWKGCYITHSTLEKWVVTNTPKLCIYWTTGGNAYFHPSEFIFNHDFAKALWSDKEHGADGAKWGTADNCTRCRMIDHEYSTYYCWEYHLQQMVVAPNPIKYLGENI